MAMLRAIPDLKNGSHWNVSSLVAHNYSKLRQLQAYNSIRNYEFICISETYLDSSVAQNSEEFQLDGYSLLRSDYPSDSKKGGVCLYYKRSLGVKIINFTALSEWILCEVSLENCKYHAQIL